MLPGRLGVMFHGLRLRAAAAAVRGQAVMAMVVIFIFIVGKHHAECFTVEEFQVGHRSERTRLRERVFAKRSGPLSRSGQTRRGGDEILREQL